MSAEVGGMNSMIPIALAVQTRRPVVDGDLMGRAYPEIQLVDADAVRHRREPDALGDERGNVVDPRA